MRWYSFFSLSKVVQRNLRRDLIDFLHVFSPSLLDLIIWFDWFPGFILGNINYHQFLQTKIVSIQMYSLTIPNMSRIAKTFERRMSYSNLTDKKKRNEWIPHITRTNPENLIKRILATVRILKTSSNNPIRSAVD